MSHYLFSDVHLRPDYPDRAERLARWVGTLRADDTLVVVGDLCDFWMAARGSEAELMRCEGLRALAEFRARGGGLQILAGNHDLWLCPYYEKALGAEILEEPLDRTIHGIRVHLVHGHLLGARRRWKSLLESSPFHRAFGQVPGPLAGMLDQLLEWKNQRNLLDDEERHLRIYRRYAADRRGRCDLVVMGHVHRAVDEPGDQPRMVVLGGWQRRSSHLRIDDRGAHLFVDDVTDPDGSRPAALPGEPSTSDSRSAIR